MSMDQQHIDSLLERYLSLLDEYTSLRAHLSTLQSGVYHNIARANFSAERGLRYGQDHYDERMQASRRLRIGNDGDAAPTFNVVGAAAGDEDHEDYEDRDRDTDGKDTAEDAQEVRFKPVNPLRWFGLLTPMPLRNAQDQSAEAVVEVIPRLLTVNAKMLNLEIEVRRARKKRAKEAEKKTTTGATPVDTGFTEVPNTTPPVEAS